MRRVFLRPYQLQIMRDNESYNTKQRAKESDRPIRVHVYCKLQRFNNYEERTIIDYHDKSQQVVKIRELLEEGIGEIFNRSLNHLDFHNEGEWSDKH